MRFTPLVVFPELFGLGDILRLGRLVSAEQKQDQPLPLKTEINAVPRSIIDTQFVNALPHGTIITKISESRPIQSHTDSGSALNISKIFEPFLERSLAICRNVIVDFIGKGLRKM
jgi:hypothetical protein